MSCSYDLLPDTARRATVMSPSDALTLLKPTEATTYLVCAQCGQSILKGERYYRAYEASGRTLTLMPRRPYCVRCAHKKSTAWLKH